MLTLEHLPRLGVYLGDAELGGTLLARLGTGVSGGDELNKGSQAAPAP